MSNHIQKNNVGFKIISDKWILEYSGHAEFQLFRYSPAGSYGE